MKSAPVDWYHLIPPHVQGIMEVVRSKGRKIYVVGGAVRDLWLGLTPKDFDLVSDASVEEIEEWFPKTLGVGREFGIMVVVTEGGPIEVARFRTDGEYTDKRHPNSISYADPAADAHRRDFTINALFYDPLPGQVMDYVGGMEDLKNKVLRTVGEPEKRFEEDALRMLRALRFHCRFSDFSFGEGLLPAISAHASRIRAVSKERITEELRKSVQAGRWALLARELETTGLGSALGLKRALEGLPETESLASPELQQGLGVFLALHGAPLEGFVLSKEEKRVAGKAVAIAQELKASVPPTRAAQRKLLASSDFWAALLFLSPEERCRWRDQKKELEAAGPLLPPPLVTAKDLLAMGASPGPQLGRILALCYEKQLNESLNQQEALLDYVKRELI